MDGHYDILRRAVDRMREPDRRLAVYDHARRVLVQQMRSAEPPIPDVVIQAEQETLEAAIRRVEAEMDGRALHRPAAPRSTAPRPAADMEGRVDPRPAAERPAVQRPAAQRPAAQRPAVPRPAVPRPAVPRPAGPLDVPAGPLDVAEEVPAAPPRPLPKWAFAAVAVGVVAIGAVALAVVLLPGKRPPAPVTRTTPPAKVAVQPSAPDARVEVDDRSPPADAAAATRSYTYGRQLTYYRTTHPAGTLIIDKGQRFLYLIRANTSAVRYGIGLGRECFDLPALMQVTRKVAAQPGDKDDATLGARRVFLDTDARLIHGTNRPDTIGHSVWLGCVRLMNEDIIDLYDQAAVGGRVVVME
jgi:lipoprotein-anchoring transpeptidase ErfK/SrfK